MDADPFFSEYDREYDLLARDLETYGESLAGREAFEDELW